LLPGHQVVDDLAGDQLLVGEQARHLALATTSPCELSDRRDTDPTRDTQPR
jgi:hypothetical protein